MPNFLYSVLFYDFHKKRERSAISVTEWNLENRNRDLTPILIFISANVHDCKNMKVQKPRETILSDTINISIGVIIS